MNNIASFVDISGRCYPREAVQTGIGENFELVADGSVVAVVKVNCPNAVQQSAEKRLQKNCPCCSVTKAVQGQ